MQPPTTQSNVYVTVEAHLNVLLVLMNCKHLHHLFCAKSYHVYTDCWQLLSNWLQIFHWEPVMYSFLSADGSTTQAARHSSRNIPYPTTKQLCSSRSPAGSGRHAPDGSIRVWILYTEGSSHEISVLCKYMILFKNDTSCIMLCRDPCEM